MFTNIEAAFKGLLTCLQAYRMYGLSHPMFTKSLDNAYASFEDVLAERQEMVIGIVGEDLAFEKEIFFDLSKFLRPAILYLKERNIERLAFLRGLSKDELRVFIEFIARPKEDFKGDIQEMLNLTGIENINIGKLKVEVRKDKADSGPDQRSLYDSSADKINQALSGVLNFEKIDHLALKLSLSNIMESLSTQRQELLKLATVKRYDMETYIHMLNVSILAMYFSARLGFEKSDVLNIGVAAMFHDIGKLFISLPLCQSGRSSRRNRLNGGRQIPGFHLSGLGQHDGMLDSIFQFPDIARPGVIQEQSQGFGIEPLEVFPPGGSKKLQEMLDQ